MLLADLLSVHPLLNGNRRAAMAAFDAYVRRFGIVPDWQRISKGEFYFAVRLASNGHFAHLIDLLTRISKRELNPDSSPGLGAG